MDKGQENIFKTICFCSYCLLVSYSHYYLVYSLNYLSDMYQIFTLFYGSGHWSLLVLCHFDETNCSDIKKGPRMIVLDSLNTADPTRFQSAIRKYASLISPF